LEVTVELDCEIHLSEIKDELWASIDAKYRQGQAEHGGKLWEHDVYWLLDQAIMETLDLAVYLLTLRTKLEKIR
jgi:hypothetical protein